MKQIIKRDGTLQDFDKSKIESAILKAFESTDGEISDYAKEKAKNIASYIEELSNIRELTIEEIQTYVENGLMSTKRKDVAHNYIEYRLERTRVRSWNTRCMKIIEQKIRAENIVNQNANVDEMSYGGRRGEAISVLMSEYALDNCVSEKTRENHLKNRIYIHDRDSYAVGMHNCISLPLDNMLAKTIYTRQTSIRPANSINTAFQLLAVYFQLQSLQQFGGVAATHLDWTMVPYLRKSFYKHFIIGSKYIARIDDNLEKYLKENKELPLDLEGLKENYPKTYKYAMDMTERELKQAVEGMYHNLNTLQSRSGNQLPFSSINYGTCTLPEGRMITKALLEVSIEGIGEHHLTPIFPCGIFQLMKGVNRKPGDPNYDLYQLALKSTAKRLYPNYANVDWSGNEGYDINDPCTYFSTMGL